MEQVAERHLHSVQADEQLQCLHETRLCKFSAVMIKQSRSPHHSQDMHGLPIEKATEKKLSISGRDQIEHLGVDKFIEECRALALDNLKEMTATFKELGVWMDWDTPYMTISKEFMEGVWWYVIGTVWHVL